MIVEACGHMCEHTCFTFISSERTNIHHALRKACVMQSDSDVDDRRVHVIMDACLPTCVFGHMAMDIMRKCERCASTIPDKQKKDHVSRLGVPSDALLVLCTLCDQGRVLAHSSLNFLQSNAA